MDLGGILTAATSGGALGFLGQFISRGLNIWELREHRADLQLEQAQELKRWAHEKDLLQLQMQARSQETEQELDVADAASGWQARTAAMEAEAAIRPSWPWVEAVRALIRPVLTLECQALLVLVYFAGSAARQADLRTAIAESIMFNASATLLWWFGERAQRRGGK